VEIESLHHAALPVSDLERAAAFYRDVLGLRELARPDFPFPGKWFEVGGQQTMSIGFDELRKYLEEQKIARSLSSGF
jgi:catechol 2,3-dioxygenase-like lactoylglutathione lyase family enzyme